MTSLTDSSATARQAADMMEQNYVPLAAGRGASESPTKSPAMALMS